MVILHPKLIYSLNNVQSKHDAAEFHAAARAVGGCGVYVRSDTLYTLSMYIHNLPYGRTAKKREKKMLSQKAFEQHAINNDFKIPR